VQGDNVIQTDPLQFFDRLTDIIILLRPKVEPADHRMHLANSRCRLGLLYCVHHAAMATGGGPAAIFFRLPAWRGNGTPTEDDGGGSLLSAAVNNTGIKEFSLQDLYPLSLVNPSERHCSSTTCSCVPLEVLAHMHLAKAKSNTP
jgi:hypothetical protein